MQKGQRLELLRQERITRNLMAHIVDSLFEDSYSILFDYQENLIKDQKRNTVYDNIYDEIDVSDSMFTNEEFINMTIRAYTDCQFEFDESSYYLPPNMIDILDKINEFYDEIMIQIAENSVVERWKEDGREDEIGNEEYIEDLDTEYEMLCECIYGYECVDIENRVESVLDNFGLTYITEIYSSTPYENVLSYEGIINSSKRLLFEPTNPDKWIDLGGSITPAPYPGGNINVTEDLERGYSNILRMLMEF